MKKAIFGAGTYGRLCRKILENTEVKVECFVQSTSPICKMVDGIPVYSLEDFMCLGRDWTIGIAINDENAVFEVTERLIREGYITDRIFDMRGFVQHNKNLLFEHKCLICKKTVHNWLSGGEKNSFFEDNKISGGGYRENMSCPLCGALDRERFLYYMLENYTDIFEKKDIKVLHFAPEYHVKELLRSQVDYYPVDLYPIDSSIHRMDVTNILFSDQVFDFVIINHVLEHILDEKAAMKELLRVLRPDGILIFSFPIAFNNESTIEADCAISEAEAVERFGQKDHVRIYGRDYIDRFEKYGLQMNIYRPRNILSEELIERYGFMAEDVLIMAKMTGAKQ